VDDINLFDPVFTLTLLQFAPEGVLLGMTTLNGLLNEDGHQVLPVDAIPFLNERIVFTGELYSIRFEEIVIVIEEISRGVPLF
jgi:hypothetical protein